MHGRLTPLRNRLLASLNPHENIYNIPNLLTFSRLLSAPVVGYFILNDHHLAALGLFIYAGVTDLIDGWMARKYNLQTVVGTVIDPMADKALMTVVTVCLAMKAALPGEFKSLDHIINNSFPVYVSSALFSSISGKYPKNQRPELKLLDQNCSIKNEIKYENAYK